MGQPAALIIPWYREQRCKGFISGRGSLKKKQQAYPKRNLYETETHCSHKIFGSRLHGLKINVHISPKNMKVFIRETEW
jgi:hypothetical protein